MAISHLRVLLISSLFLINLIVFACFENMGIWKKIYKKSMKIRIWDWEIYILDHLPFSPLDIVKMTLKMTMEGHKIVIITDLYNSCFKMIAIVKRSFL